jgi:hypothetical protein
MALAGAATVLVAVALRGPLMGRPPYRR